MSKVRNFPPPRAEVLALRSISRDHSRAARSEARALTREHAAHVVARALESASDRLEMVVALRDAALDRHAQLTSPITAACSIMAKGHRMAPSNIVVVQAKAKARAIADAHFPDTDAEAA